MAGYSLRLVELSAIQRNIFGEKNRLWQRASMRTIENFEQISEDAKVGDKVIHRPSSGVYELSPYLCWFYLGVWDGEKVVKKLTKKRSKIR